MVDKNYWASELPHPLSPSNEDYEIYYSYRGIGTTLLLGCTRKLMNMADDIMDIDPWCEGDYVIKKDWRDNTKFYNYIMLDGGLCFTKKLCDGIVEMASKNCNTFVSRTFNHKLPQHRIAAYFPKREDFLIKPFESRVFDDYTFHVWKF